MYKYIVTWIITLTTTAPCPTSNMVDEFGMTSNYSTSCSVLHVSSSKRTETKTFISVDSANAFYKRAKQQSDMIMNFTLGDKITDVKLDTVLYISDLKIKEVN